MRRSFTLTTLILTLGLLLVGSIAATPAIAGPGGVHAVQGRGKKKHHRAKSPRSARPKPAKSASASPKKNDRGFEL
jgi:hypothetical protein